MVGPLEGGLEESESVHHQQLKTSMTALLRGAAGESESANH
jgi:hypothetical protein